MATPVMTEQPATQPRPVPSGEPVKADLDPAIQSIINRARASVPRPAGRGALLLSFATGLLMYASFRPLDFSPLAWIATVPLLLLVRIPRATRWMYSGLYLGGLVFFVPALQWMRLGDQTMYPAWIALAAYLAFYFPLFVGLTRSAVWNLKIPMTVAAPMIWVAMEFARAHVMTGLAWYYLGHTQYRWTTLIQVSDLVGAYGVSFIMMTTAATIALIVSPRFATRFKLVLPATGNVLTPSNRQKWIHTGASIAVFSCALIYGQVRRNAGKFETGPRVALIQGNFPTSVKHDPEEVQTIFNEHYALTMTAVHLGQSPDLIVWPETMFRGPLLVNEAELSAAELSKRAPNIPTEWWVDNPTPTILGDLSQETGAAMAIGLEAAVAETDEVRYYNSAAFITPDGGVSRRYDKMHRVPFGEYIPLKDELPWLSGFTPFGPDFGIDEGRKPEAFAYNDWRMSPIICFEDTVPHLVRQIMNSTTNPENGEQVDCLVNLTNDGWFHGSSELDQHLITASFRCIENRVPMIRSVNTGISAVIDGNGQIIEPELVLDEDGEKAEWLDPETGEWRKEWSSAIVHNVPLDSRTSFYTRAGDWFAWLCATLALFAGILGILDRFSGREVAAAPVATA